MHAASPQHIWEGYGMEIGRLRGLVRRKEQGKGMGMGK